MKKWIILSLWLILTGCSSSAMVRQELPDGRVICQVSDLPRILDAADRSLLDAYRTLHEIKGFAHRGALGVYTPQDREIFLTEMKILSGRVHDILENARFLDFKIYSGRGAIPERVVSVRLSENESPVAFTFSASGPLELLADFPGGITATSSGFEQALIRVEGIIQAMELELARMDTYRERLELAGIFRSITTAGTDARRVLGLKQMVLDRLYQVCILASNGETGSPQNRIYDLRFRALSDELVRIEAVSGIGSQSAVFTNISLTDAGRAEKMSQNLPLFFATL